MTGLSDFQYRPRLLTPQLGFQVIHYQNFPFDRHAPAIAHNLGIYSSLTKAQTVARDSLEHVLLGYVSKGHVGRCWDNPVDLIYRGLITAYVEVLRDEHRLREEVWLSEFHIQIVHVLDPTWEAHTKADGEEALFSMAVDTENNPNSRRSTPQPAVKLPIDSRTSAPIQILQRPVSRLPPVETYYSEEQDATWARSRTSWLDRRPDPPFRRPDEQHHAQAVGVSPSLPSIQSALPVFGGDRE